MSWFDKHQRQRAAADAKRNAALANARDQRATREASWEQKSSASVAKISIQRKIQARKAQIEKDLNRRRHRLAALLESERRAYEKEIEAGIETDEQRRARMIQQARVLQEQRLMKQKQEVAAIREQQFRDGIDEYRRLKSRAIKLECHRQRQEAIAAKPAIIAQKKKEEIRLHNEYLALGEKMLEREIREKEALAQANKQTKEMIAQQLEEKKRFTQLEEEERRRDLAAWRQSLEEANVAEENKRRAVIEARKQNVREMFEENARNIVRAKKLAEKEKAIDDALLKAALDKEKEQAKKEAEHMASRAEEAKRFQAFLKARLVKESVDESALFAVLEEEDRKSWEKKEKVWAENEARRQKLADEVDAGRKAQQERKRQQQVEAEIAKQQYRRELMEKNAAEELKEAQKQAKKKEEAENYRRTLNADIAARAQQRKDAFAAEVAEKQQMAANYVALNQKINNVMGSNYKPPEHYRKKKVEWYF